MSSTTGVTGASSTPYSVSAPITNGSVNVSASTTSGTAPASTATASSSSSGTTALGENDFLQLLITQLENQDPTSPMDDTQFVSELAQFQSLESSNNTEQAVETLNTTMTTAASAQQQSANAVAGASAVALIGKTVQVQLSSIPYSGSGGESIPVYLGSSDSATVKIEDSSGTVIKTLAAQGSGTSNVDELSWDGTDDAGQPVAAGTYSIVTSNASNDSYAFTQGTVSGVSNQSGSVTVDVNGSNYSLSNVMEISQGTSN
jgi:flagellar basal-body rod modification protein FlgD